jgi:tRNA uridine 5-carboxymethylaminomethyl modification enzyme
MGLASKERMEKTTARKEGVGIIKQSLQQLSVEPFEVNSWLESIGDTPLFQKQKAGQLLLRPAINLKNMVNAINKLKEALGNYNDDELMQAEIQLKYDVYIEKEKELVKRMGQLEDLLIPDSFNYDKLTALSNEAKQKFKRIKPQTLGQASRISGVNPSDIQILMVYMGR